LSVVCGGAVVVLPGEVAVDAGVGVGVGFGVGFGVAVGLEVGASVVADGALVPVDGAGCLVSLGDVVEALPTSLATVVPLPPPSAVPVTLSNPVMARIARTNPTTLVPMINGQRRCRSFEATPVLVPVRPMSGFASRTVG
jgi:hypothetical protein